MSSLSHSASMPEHRDVQVARITAKQAVIVATITALAGIAGGYFGRPTADSALPQTRQYRLRILGVTSVDTAWAVRIIAHVDGDNYSYPGQALWADIGSDMSQEDFPLVVGKSEYRIRFSAFVRDKDGAILQASSQESQAIPVSSAPIERDYVLRLLANVGFSRSTARALTVRYEVR